GGGPVLHPTVAAARRRVRASPLPPGHLEPCPRPALVAPGRARRGGGARGHAQRLRGRRAAAGGPAGPQLADRLWAGRYGGGGVAGVDVPAPAHTAGGPGTGPFVKEGFVRKEDCVEMFKRIPEVMHPQVNLALRNGFVLSVDAVARFEPEYL